MAVTPTPQFLDFHDNARVEVEDDGVYRITKPSLTGKGTHTKWVYPEESRSGDHKEDAVQNDKPEVQSLASSAGRSSLQSHLNRIVSIVASRDTFSGTEAAQEDTEEESDNWEVHAGSDATEIVDEQEEAEQLLRLKTLREGEPLPDLPWERIMTRIAQEPTLVVEDSFSSICDFF